MTTRERFVELARSYIGVTQGSDRHKALINLYNTLDPLPRGYKMSYTDSWCAAFVSTIGLQVGLTPDIILPECSCSRFIELYKAEGRWQEDDAYRPKIGDLVIYDWQDGTNYVKTDNRNAPDHVGIVASIADDDMTVIEGNKDSTKHWVAFRNLKVNGRYIRGYCLPDFESMDAIDTAEADEALEKVIESMRAYHAAMRRLFDSRASAQE